MSTVGGVTGCVLDLNAQDNDSIVLVDGKVSSWTDTAGGKVFTQATDDNRPVLGTLNGKQSVSFDGVDDFLLGPTLTIGQPFTVVQILKPNSTPGTQQIPFGAIGVAPAFHYNTGGHNGKWATWTTISSYVSTGTYSTNPVFAVTSYNGANSKLSVNGSTVTFNTSNSINSSLYLGRFTSGFNWHGEIARILIFDHALTDLELVNIEIEMGLVHGVGVVTHPTDGMPNNNDLPDNRVLHLDAQDNDSITLIDGKVAKWVDKIGNREFVQVDPAKRPVMGTLNGKQAVEFDGTDDLLVSSAAFALARPHTMFVVFKSDVASGYRALLSSRDETLGNYAFQPIQLYAGNFATWFELGSTKTHQTADTSVHVASIVDDGTDTVTRFDNGSPSVASSKGFAFANKLRLGSRTVAGNEFWDGLLGELIITSDAITEQEQLGYRYRSVRYWGFSLPSGQQIVKLSRSDHPLGSPVWKK